MALSTEIFADLTVKINHECFAETLTGPPSSPISLTYTISDPTQEHILTKNGFAANQFAQSNPACAIKYELYLIDSFGVD